MPSYTHAAIFCTRAARRVFPRQKTLQSMKNRDRDEIIRMISTRYSNLLQKKGAQRSSRQPEHTFVSSKSGDRSSARRGRGRGGSNNGAGGNSNSSGSSRNSTGGAQGSSGRGSGSGGGRLYIPPNRCFCCRQRGHRREHCTTKESEFVPRCITSTGFGHEKKSCSLNAAVPVVELPVSKEDLAVEAQTFAVTKAGKCSVTIGDAVGGVALDKQVV